MVEMEQFNALATSFMVTYFILSAFSFQLDVTKIIYKLFIRKRFRKLKTFPKTFPRK